MPNDCVEDGPRKLSSMWRPGRVPLFIAAFFFVSRETDGCTFLAALLLHADLDVCGLDGVLCGCAAPHRLYR